MTSTITVRTGYQWHWRTLSLWRIRSYPQVCGVSGISYASTEARCLFSLRTLFRAPSVGMTHSSSGAITFTQV